MTIKRHKGLPPLGWEMVPNMPGYIREKKAPPPKDGEQGPPGEPGRDGRDGVDGKDGRDGRDGVDGKDGLPGRDGVDGKDGRDGKDGKPGPRGERGLPGLAGKDGEDGIGIDDVVSHGQDVLFKLSDGNEKRIKIFASGGTPFGGGGGGSGSGGVTKIVAGENVTISPFSGTGEVTINAASAAGAFDYGSIADPADIFEDYGTL